ncbi:MAG: hypothetical protein ACYTJ0_00265, partial [Planctomycetota bacterium]
MKHVIRIVTALVLAHGPAAFGQTDNRNGATWYQRAFEIRPQLTEEQRDLVDRYRRNPVGPPPAELRQVLGQYTGAMGHLRRGARQKYSDYRLDYDQGFSLALPHLASSRHLAQVMQTDAMVQLHDGNVAGAMDRIAAIYRMGGHVGQDRIVISSLVAQAVWSTGDDALQIALDRGLLGPAEASVMLDAARDLPSADPFNFVEAAFMEYELAAITLQGQMDEDGMLDLDLFVPQDAEVDESLRMMTAEELDGQLDLYGEYIDAVAEIYVENDPETGEAALKALEERLGDGEFGELAQIVAPAMSRAFANKQRIEGRLAARIGLLEKIAAGADARPHANAAVWYLRAVEQLHRRPAAELAALRRDDPSPAAPIEEPVATLLADAGDVLATLREAAALTRCDFSFAHEALTPPAPALAPPYAVGLRDLQRTLLAEIRLQMERGDHAALEDRLRIAWSMVKHLETDPMFSTAISNHQAFNRLVALTTHAIETGAVTPEQRAALHSLANQLRRTDPFGYVAAIIKAREDLGGHLHRRMIYTDLLSPERYEAAEKTVRTFGGDLLLAIAAAMDTMRHSGDEDYEAHTALFALLDGVYDLGGLQQARNDVPLLAPLLATYELESLAQRPVPDIGSIARRMGEARRDLRVGLEAIRPPVPAPAPTDESAPAEGREAPARRPGGSRLRRRRRRADAVEVRRRADEQLRAG